MRLVDPQLPFKVVYAISHHQYLGYLISAHVVQLSPNGELSLVHQGAYPDNLEQFATGIDDKDRQLVALTNRTLPRELIKHFKGNPREEADFFEKRFEGKIKELALTRVQRQLTEVLPLLHDRPVFSMGNDSYPAQTPLRMLDEKATVLFHFKRYEEETVYYPTIKLHDELLKFQNQGAVLLCLKPAWILFQEQIFTFEGEVEGVKLKPFLTRFNIKIPKAKEKEYFRKFVSQLVERYRVKPEGFEIRKVWETPTFAIRVSEHDKSSFSFQREVRYGNFRFPLNTEGLVKAELDTEQVPWRFYAIQRDIDKENAARETLDRIAPNQQSLTPWEYVEREKGLQWLSTHADNLREQGIEIQQQDSQPQINLGKPQIELTTQEKGDWFDVRAIVRIGSFEIPFLKFRGHIMKGRREYELPDGSIAILPEEWFSDYRHLLEVSEQNNGEETLSIRKYQAPLLNFPSRDRKATTFADTLKQLHGIAEVEPPVNLKATLRNYQQQGLNWLYFLKDSGMGGILADDMGLGKTLQTLALLLKEHERGVRQASLAVLPTSLVHNWYNEAQKFTPDLRVLIHTGVNRSKQVARFEHYHLVLTTYGIVRQDIKALKTFPFHYLILDESQTIKNPDSKTAKAVRKLVGSHRLSITGTPVENTVMDIWSQMSFLNPGLLGSENFFKKFYVQPIERDHDAKRSAKLRRIIYPFILRRRKHQVEKDLPPRIEKLHYCEMVEEQQQFYEETRSQYRNYLMELITNGTWKRNKLNILTGLQKLRQIAIHPQMIAKEEYTLEQSGKYLEVKRLLHQIIERKRSKVLIFSQFVKMLTILREDLDREGIAYTYLDGTTKDRQGEVDRFQNDKDIPVFLISLKAGGVGLNLTAADYVFILDPWWNPAVENQAIDRSHRIGQLRTVFFYKFITKDSIEEKILSLQRRKAQLSDDIIAVEEDMYKTLEAEDLQGLLD
jgi:SNF2 family DNA or RNA helicase